MNCGVWRFRSKFHPYRSLGRWWIRNKMLFSPNYHRLWNQDSWSYLDLSKFFSVGGKSYRWFWPKEKKGKSLAVRISSSAQATSDTRPWWMKSSSICAFSEPIFLCSFSKGMSTKEDEESVSFKSELLLDNVLTMFPTSSKPRRSSAVSWLHSGCEARLSGRWCPRWLCCAAVLTILSLMSSLLTISDERTYDYRCLLFELGTEIGNGFYGRTFWWLRLLPSREKCEISQHYSRKHHCILHTIHFS